MVAHNNKIGFHLTFPIRSSITISLRRAHLPGLDGPSRAASIEPSHSSAAMRSLSSRSRDAAFDADDLDALDAMLSLNRTLSFEDSDDDKRRRRGSSTPTTPHARDQRRRWRWLRIDDAVPREEDAPNNGRREGAMSHRRFSNSDTQCCLVGWTGMTA